MQARLCTLLVPGCCMAQLGWSCLRSCSTFTFSMGLRVTWHLWGGKKMKPHPRDLPQRICFLPGAELARGLWTGRYGEEGSPAGSVTGGMAVPHLLSPLSLSAQPPCTPTTAGRLSENPPPEQTVSSDTLGYQVKKTCRHWRWTPGVEATGPWLMQSWEILAACDSTTVQ